jgi:hypothetical protein
MQTADNEGPAWNKFWLSLDHETESVVSGDGTHSRLGGRHHSEIHSQDHTRPLTLERGDSVLPNESASHAGADSPDHSAVAGAAISHDDEAPFPFKFKAPGGRVHRMQLAVVDGVAEVVSQVAAKLGSEADSIGGIPEVIDGSLGKSGFALSYLDNEGDTVSITTDHDLREAIYIARRGHRDKVDLFVHDPSQPPLSATLNPHPAVPKVKDGLRRQFEDSDDEDELGQRHKTKHQQAVPQQELIPGVPNDLLLPGAIVALAVVIVGVFAVGRASSR